MFTPRCLGCRFFGGTVAGGEDVPDFRDVIADSFQPVGAGGVDGDVAADQLAGRAPDDPLHPPPGRHRVDQLCRRTSTAASRSAHGVGPTTVPRAVTLTSYMSVTFAGAVRDRTRLSENVDACQRMWTGWMFGAPSQVETSTR